MNDAAVGSRRTVDDRVFIACCLAWGAGLIHVEAAIQHVHEYALYAVFFALVAPAQFLWGAAVYRRPSPRLLLAGAVAGALIVALWAVSRTTGLPIGPDPWTPEPVGAIDAIATGDELVVCALVSLHWRAARGRWTHIVLAAGIGLAVLSSLALMLAGHAH